MRDKFAPLLIALFLCLSLKTSAFPPSQLSQKAKPDDKKSPVIEQNKDNRKSSQNPRGDKPANSSPDQQDKIRLETKLVSLTVTVSDTYGRFVTGLTEEHFLVYDDDIKQEIAMFSDEDAPITLGIVYDVSGSMNNLTSRSFAALKKFFHTSHDDDEYFVVAFNDKPQLVQDFTTSPNEILSRTIFVKAKGSTALYDAVYLATEKVKQGRHPKKALLIISDGEENHSRYSGKELSTLLKESDVQIYAIGISELLAGAGTLNQIAGWTGGRAYFPMDGNEVGDIYTRMALLLRHQYVIGFYPTDTTAQAKWHKVKLMLHSPKGLGRLSLSYKKGYQSFDQY